MAEAAHGNLSYEYPGRTQAGCLKQPIDNLIAIGAALACSSVAGLGYYLATARASGVSIRKIQTAIGIARAIRKEAAEKADIQVASVLEPSSVLPEKTERQNEPIPGAENLILTANKCCGLDHN